ncbi:MAG: response regulator transcription factor [Elusimicrobia bacterium]|nr:response regulator transcription factor [Elusimicrobiota bacterium]
MAKRVLVIDDDDDLREVLVDWLEIKGFTPEKARNAKEAQEFLGRSVPDLILLDIMMPDMNGIELCRWIRSQPKLKDVPILQMSALADETTMKDALEMGAMDYITKPIDFKTMISKIQAALSRMERRSEGDGEGF